MPPKRALITGSSTGLGRSLAVTFAKHGYDVILHGRDRGKLEKISEEISNLRVNSIIVEGDLMLRETLDSLEREASQNGIGVLINNAAEILGAYGVPFEAIDDEIIDRTFVTNLVSAVKLSRRIYKLLVASGGGTIININSIVGLETKATNILYGASKWGLRGFTNTLALEGKKNNIRVIGIYLTRVQTRKEFTYGMDPNLVSEKIYDFYTQSDQSQLVLDDRPEEFKPKK